MIFTPDSPPPTAAEARELIVHLAERYVPGVRELPGSTDLADHGLGSIELMSLTSQLRAHGCDLTFIDLIDAPSIEAWVALLTRGAVT
ncbi:aryl carrier-like protein [Klugiella xanthotipulae]|uniref:Aryl carrier-like protein n=1 Tax=Klugiella xanthotipulae TaxID=244735 RepID=A0A543HHB0_9MICO|nr:aryl carrier-like protein [Klugiella xanthotipulae]